MTICKLLPVAMVCANFVLQSHTVLFAEVARTEQKPDGNNPVEKRITDPKQQVAKVLDEWHIAAGRADEEAYFGAFAADGVFLGTDATERWTRDEFRKWAKPHFDKGTAWKFKAARRAIFLAPEGTVAWFDEDLSTEKLGPCRGSGVLLHQNGNWKIAQYVLSVPVPNESFADVKKIIEAALEVKTERPTK